MAPRCVAVSQLSRRTFARDNCPVTRLVSSSCQVSKLASRTSGAWEPHFGSVLPVDQSAGLPNLLTSPSDSAQGSKRKVVSFAEDDRLSSSDLTSPSLFLPGIVSCCVDDADVRTPPAWKSPYLVDSTSKVETELPESVCESELPCGSPTKTPSRVAKVFAQLLPITPRQGLSKKPVSNFKHQGSQIVSRGLRVICRVGTVIGTMSHNPNKPKTFKSTVDLRRYLLQRHRSLHKAFKEMETHLREWKHQQGVAWKKCNVADGLHTSMELSEFTKAIAFFGVNAQEALHFFKLMDTNEDGMVTFEEFKTALVTMPREVLLQDFRARLLTRFCSTHEAFNQLSAAAGRQNKFAPAGHRTPLTKQSLAFQLSRLGVEEQESSLLFDLIDKDASGVISMEELRETMREVAPTLSPEEFWHRFNSRWPHIRAAANGRPGRTVATELLFKLLPAKYCGTSLDMPLGLPAEAWDILCCELDVSRTNAKDLFRQCQTAKVWQGHRPGLEGCLERLDSFDHSQAECDLDDFFDELQLWSQTPLARQGPGMKQSYGRDLAQHMRAIKAKVAEA